MFGKGWYQKGGFVEKPSMTTRPDKPVTERKKVSKEGKGVSEQNQPLLSIVIDDETSDPKVIYKGEEVKHKISVTLDWDTETHTTMGGLTYAIEYADVNKRHPSTNRIEQRVKGHA